MTVNLSYLRKLKPILAPHCLLTDVGSVKGDIARAVKDLGLEKQFIGGHPMAGSEAIGYEHSSEYLLENAYYILTPGEGVPGGNLPGLLSTDKTDGSYPPSHVPGQARFLHGGYQSSSPCGSGLRGSIRVREADDEASHLEDHRGGKDSGDIPRIASSSPVMWQNICLTNQREILQSSAISIWKSLQDLPNGTGKCRQRKPAGGISVGERLPGQSADSSAWHPALPVYEFYCDLIDEAGGIATIATILATNQLSIKNIGIIHNRRIPGRRAVTFRRSAATTPSLEAAVALLQRNHYTIHL